jgi:hypothetical protein
VLLAALLEMLGYCAQGAAGGYQCSTEGDLYIVTTDIKPEFARRRLRRIGVIERSSFCRARISFALESVSTSTTLEPGTTIT